MKDRVLRVLLVEDDEDDYVLCREMLAENGRAGYDLEWAATYDAALAAIERRQHDVYLLDYRFGQCTGVDLLREAIGRGCRAPMILLTGQRNHEVDLQAMQAGAADYLVKGQIDATVLERSIRYAVARRQAEDALRESEERFRILSASAPLGIFQTDAEGQCTYTNARWEAISGRRAEECLGLGWCNALPPGDSDWVLSSWLQAVAERRDFAAEHRIRTASGVERWVNCRAAPMLASDGRLAGYVGTLEDITERKLLEDQLRQSQKMEAIGRLAGGTAHDFNNMIGAITGYADLLLHHVGPDPVVRGFLDEIMKAGERAAALTRQLLAFSRKSVLTPRLLDLNEVVTNVSQMLRRVIGADIELVTMARAAMAPVKADPAQIEQVLLNLAINARDAMPDGGTLTIETENVLRETGVQAFGHSSVQTFGGADGCDGSDRLDRLPERLNVQDRVPEERVEFVAPETGPGSGARVPPPRSSSPERPNACVMLTVTDTGCGMDRETQAHIFEPFFTTKEHGKGTGLGLATVYGIVEQSGGWIEVESQPGAGTTFRIFLPRSEGVPVSEPAQERAPQPPGGSETILLVEDEPVVRKLVVEVLRMNGYTVLEAIQGGDALRLCRERKERIDLLLTDVMMPGMSGRELAQRLTAARPETKVLFMSGYTDDAVLRHELFEAGVAFIQKPFKPAALAQKVRDLLGAAEARVLPASVS